MIYSAEVEHMWQMLMPTFSKTQTKMVLTARALSAAQEHGVGGVAESRQAVDRRRTHPSI